MNANVVYLIFYILVIISILEFVFFILFLISYGNHNNIKQSAQYSTDTKKYPKYLTGMIALEFLMFFSGIGQLIFYILAFKCKKHLLYLSLNIISLICFLSCWICSVILFATSPEYKFIKSINNENIEFFSWDSFNSQIKSWSSLNPFLYFHAIGSIESKICSSFINISTQNLKHSFDSSNVNFKDFSGNSLVLIDLQVDIKWNSKNLEKIKNIQNEIKQCACKIINNTKVFKFDGLKKIPDAILMSKSGKIPKKLTKNLAMTRAFFGLGYDVIMDLTSIPVYKRKINIDESVFNYTFDCSKFNFRCVNIPNEDDINSEIKKMNNKHQKENKITKKDNKIKKLINTIIKGIFYYTFLDRKILSRSFYLSRSAYTGSFDSYSHKTFGFEIVDKFHSGKLMNIKKSNLDNDVFKPVWYLGTHENELYVVIRGSDSPFDWVTNFQITTVVNTDYSYHRGFYFAARYVWGEIAQTINDYKQKGFTIIFTGHSYGGSVAQILHHIYVKAYGRNGACSYVFGAATSMGKTPAATINDDSFSFVYCNDIVPRLMKYVSYLKQHGNFEDTIINTAISEEIQSQLKNSEDWNPSKLEDIEEPIGKIYHLPPLDIYLKDWGSIYNAEITINNDFYHYNCYTILFAISDHDLHKYFENMKYFDGIIIPSQF